MTSGNADHVSPSATEDLIRRAAIVPEELFVFFRKLSAIFPLEELSEKWKQYAELNANYVQGGNGAHWNAGTAIDTLNRINVELLNLIEARTAMVVIGIFLRVNAVYLASIHTGVSSTPTRGSAMT